MGVRLLAHNTQSAVQKLECGVGCIDKESKKIAMLYNLVVYLILHSWVVYGRPLGLHSCASP